MQRSVTTLDIRGGTTATVALLKEGKLYIANLGDSRSVLVRKNNTIESLTRDHRASDESEQEIIRSNGGTIESVKGEMRVNGTLAVTRAIGDSELNSLIRDPEIKEIKIDKPFLDKTKYLIIASDGLWDYASYLFVLFLFHDCLCFM